MGHPSQEPSVLSPAEVGDIRVSVLGHCAPCHPTSTRNKCTFERADARQPSLSGAQRRAPAPVQALGDGCDAGTSPTDLSGTLQSLISCFPNGLGEKVCPCALYNTCGASNHSKEAGEVWHRSPRCRSISWVLPYPWLWLSPPCHDPAGSATTRSPASPLLRGGATRSSLPHLSLATPTVLQPFHRRSTSQHGASVWDTGTYAAALLHPSSCAPHQRYPQETGAGGQGCAARQLCPPPRRRHPSTAGTFTLS